MTSRLRVGTGLASKRTCNIGLIACQRHNRCEGGWTQCFTNVGAESALILTYHTKPISACRLFSLTAHEQESPHQHRDQEEKIQVAIL